MEPVCLFASAKSLIDSLFALCAEAETGGNREMKPSDAGEQLLCYVSRSHAAVLASHDEKMWDS